MKKKLWQKKVANQSVTPLYGEGMGERPSLSPLSLERGWMAERPRVTPLPGEGTGGEA